MSFVPVPPTDSTEYQANPDEFLDTYVVNNLNTLGAGGGGGSNAFANLSTQFPTDSDIMDNDALLLQIGGSFGIQLPDLSSKLAVGETKTFTLISDYGYTHSLTAAGPAQFISAVQFSPQVDGGPNFCRTLKAVQRFPGQTYYYVIG